MKKFTKAKSVKTRTRPKKVSAPSREVLEILARSGYLNPVKLNAILAQAGLLKSDEKSRATIRRPEVARTPNVLAIYRLGQEQGAVDALLSWDILREVQRIFKNSAGLGLSEGQALRLGIRLICEKRET